LKVVRNEEDLTSMGIEFESDGAEKLKTRLPNLFNIWEWQEDDCLRKVECELIQKDKGVGC